MPEAIEPVKLLVAALWADERALRSARDSLQEAWGTIDFEGADHPFDVTDYYQAEMGSNLRRRLLSFARLVPPPFLVQAKLEAVEIEDRLRSRRDRSAGGPSGRAVNLDAGYLDNHKLVLASLKRAGQKIYLDRGVHADIIVRYAHGRFKPFEWTFPDFRDGRYDQELLEIRRLYMEELRRQRPASSA
jgi:hypothetical protein